MITTTRNRLTGSRPSRLVVAVGLLAAAFSARAADDPKEPEKLPDGVTAVTKEDLVSRVPHFFCFGVEEGDRESKRWWLRVDDTHWVERYPDGLESKFKMLGRSKAGDRDGTIAYKIAGDPEKTGTPNDGTFQVFIPDKSKDGPMRFSYRFGEKGGTNWNELAEMKSVE